MTPPATGTALLPLAGFILPGFVAVLLNERLYEVRGEESTFDRLLTTVYYSLLVYLLPALSVALLSVLGILDRSGLEHFATGRSPLWLIGLVGVVVLLVLAALAAVGAWQWMNSSIATTALRIERSPQLRAPDPRRRGTSRSTTTKTSCSLSS